MQNISPIFIFFIVCALSVISATAASRTIDFLYRKNAALLQTVPTRTPRLRLPLLFLGFLLCWWSLGANAGEISLSGVFLIPCGFLLLVVTVTDWEQRLILDDTTLLLVLLGLAQSISVSYASAAYAPLLENLSAAFVGGLVFFLLALLTRGGVGGGDIKLVAALGLWLGPDRLLAAVCSGLLLGGLAALFLLLTGKKKRKDAFAYGPCFTLPALILLFG